MERTFAERVSDDFKGIERDDELREPENLSDWQVELSRVKADVQAQFAALTEQQDAAKIQYLEVKQGIAKQRRKMTLVTRSIEARLAEVRKLRKEQNIAQSQKRDDYFLMALWKLVDRSAVSGQMDNDWHLALNAIREEWQGQGTEDDTAMWSQHYTNQDGK